ncbi:MAG TPA: tRNA dihydrouridine(20/20a) synthase DusA [Paracoccaceae bacterium]|nr:tRNA dihydrouridine(20/20a) synthase DusA [Paracoccaceae bacterium]
MIADRPERRLSVAPMMDWTDRHCRVLHRRLSRRALLYTEMVVASAVVRGDAARLLRWRPEREGAVALQLGGSDPGVLAEAVRIAAGFGYAEVNLNVGCPSDRVQGGRFGACLMREPERVAACVAAMIGASAAEGGPEITVKCRIGVDEQDPAVVLPAFLDRLQGAGVRSVAVHARKAWLQGLSPKENRERPPLDYALVEAAKAARPGMEIVLNGGIGSLDAAEAALARGVDGVMIGRAAWNDPGGVLAAADRRIFGAAGSDADPEAAARDLLGYVEEELAAGERLHRIVKPWLGLFAGRRGARAFRRVLSEEARAPGAGPEVVERALAALEPVAA